MPQRLPRRLLLMLGVVSVVSFALSMYLELYRLQFLQNHPITVNLISGVVGFSTGGLVLGYGFNWFTKRDAAAAGRKQLAGMDVALRELLRHPKGLYDHLMAAIDLLQAAKVYLSDHAPRTVTAMRASVAEPIQRLIREAHGATTSLDEFLQAQEVNDAFESHMDGIYEDDESTVATEITTRAIEVWKRVFRVADNIGFAERSRAVFALLESRPAPDALLPNKEPAPTGQRLAGWEQRPPSIELVEELARFGMKIQAVKMHRELTGANLKDSVDAINELANPDSSPS